MPTLPADEDDGGGYTTVGASRRATRRQAQQPDYRALHTGKPTRQRRSHAETTPELPIESSESTLDDVIGLLNLIVAQNDQLTERNEALAEQVASYEDEIMRLRSALEMSEETQVKMEERMGKMEKQMAALVETTRSNLTSQSQINASYASALKNMPTTPPTSANTSPASMPAMPVRAAITNTPLPLSPPPAIELDLSEANIDTTKPGDIRARFQKALESQEATKNIKCCGLTRYASDVAKVRLLFRSKDDEETVRLNSGWLDTAFRGARMRGRQWYPVKVDSVNKTAVFNEERTGLRADACEMMSKENEVEIVHARWLSKPSDRLYGSMVIYLTKKSAADALLAGRVMDIGGEAAYTNVFEHRPRPRRCFRCQSYDHQQFRCSGEERCVKCAGYGHREDKCNSSVEKCAACNGPHRADDRGCPRYKKLLEEMMGRSER